MEWINGFGILIMIIIMIPNMVYAIIHKDMVNLCKNKVVNVLEQVGRYGCFALMCIPIPFWRYNTVTEEVLKKWQLSMSILLLLYLIFWVMYFIHTSRNKALALAIIPSMIFISSGILLKQYLLLVCAILFAFGHIYVTDQNNKILS